MICPKCGGGMNERNVDFLTSYNDTLNSLDSLYKKFVFFSIFPFYPFYVRTNGLVYFFVSQLKLKTFLCPDCSFIGNNLFPTDDAFKGKVKNPTIYIVIILTLMIIVALLINWAIIQSKTP
ncbi:MAG: hypothetical protein NTZ55_05080 [Candidatus Roizmanbacteria bacterium]|nr:hypothetical protein [Candidatus Roizmanbacteria bacterium]